MNASRKFVSIQTLIAVLFLLFGSTSTGLALSFYAMPSNNVLLLDGVDDYASATDSASLDLGSGLDEDFTMESFFYVPNLTKSNPVNLIWKNGAYGLYILYSGTTQDRFVFRVNVSPLINDYVYIFYDVNLAVGWHHVAAVYDNEFTPTQDLLALYLDGSQVKIGGGFDVTPGIYNSSSALNLGGYLGINSADGPMEEVRFSNIVRYSGPYTVPTTPFTNDANTRALWHFDEAAGSTTFFDSSGHGNTLHGINGAKTGQFVVPPVTISGSVGVSQATLNYLNGTPKSVISLPNGAYSITVPTQWSGTITPTHVCFSFTPASRNYSGLTINQTGQNYTPAAKAGCADISILVNGINQGRFGVPAHGSTRASFGVNNGPVKIASTNATKFIAAERVIYKVNNTNTSLSEMMGLPNGQLDNTYWLPWYNNKDLDTQLRFANVDPNLTATVHVKIGGIEVTGCLPHDSPFTLQPGESVRVSCAGLNNGPVQIQSNVSLVAAERIIYKVNNVNTSFSEMMALPNKQLDKVYWLPWYNNTDLDTQLRFANVTTNQIATVHVKIKGKEVTGCLPHDSPFTLQPGESVRVSCAGLNSGPVQIQSNVSLVAAERIIYKVNNVNTSFSEMMALPNTQLDNTYWLPWYNNKDLDTQLRFANVDPNLTATVHVKVGGIEVTGCLPHDSPFTLQPGESVRVSCAGLDNGPVQIQSNVSLVAAERIIYKVNNVNTSFSEMMALPNTQLSNTYWLPWYNNKDLDTQLRFGVP